MGIHNILILFILLPTYLCQDINYLFTNINNKVLEFNTKAAEIAWESSINPGNPDLSRQASAYQKERIKWEQDICRRLATLQNGDLLNSSEARQTYLLCRGPMYTFDEARELSNFYEELQTIYTEAKICIPSTENVTLNDFAAVESAILKYLYNQNKMAPDLTSEAAHDKYFCLKGEDDFEKVMMLSRNELVLKWTWLIWREMAIPMKKTYRRLVDVENVGARRNGYKDIGDSWREELEIPHLRMLCRKLYEDIKPLYTVLHGVVRFYLRKQYGDVVSERGPIPAHLLGNLWSHNWEPLADLIAPKTIDLNQRIKELNWTVLHMVKRAEDFYQSFGLPAMTETFWRESVFTRGNDTRCHGTAADMFKDGDFRLLYCSGTTKEDFYVLHHEMGHIYYFMAYAQQPALFRQANAALHESIGDAIMYGVLTPQHLHRLGLINDSLLYKMDSNQLDFEKAKTKDLNALQNNFVKKEIGLTAFDNNFDKDIGDEKFAKDFTKIDFDKDMEDVFKDTDDILMLKEALSKIPQIPFSLLMDEYRWKYFERDLSEENNLFWRMSLELQGIEPPYERGEKYFDIGAKFHVPDNTPYIRYFLSSFLQHQLFESLCKAAVFGQRNSRNQLPDSITLNRCDIYGSKAAGKILKDLMFRGHSQHWRDILYETTGERNISSSALLRYYRPLYNLLRKLVKKYDIPIGWSD